MADTKLADLTALTTPSGDDILYIVDDPAGTPLDRKIALDNLFTRGTITADAPVLNMSQTWNNAAVTFTGLKFNAAGTSDANSAAASLLMDLQVGGTSRFSVSKAGALLGPNTTFEIRSFSTNAINFFINSNRFFGLDQGDGFRLASGMLVCWSSSATDVNVTRDLFIGRRAAANLRLGAADTTGTTAPTPQFLSAQSWLSSTTNNQTGANFTIDGSQGTGTGAGGSIIFRVAPAGGSGTAQNALSTALTIASTNAITVGANGTISFPTSATTLPSAPGIGNWVGTLGIFGTSGTLAATVSGSNINMSSTVSLEWGNDTRLFRDAANTLAQRNANNGQTFRLYGRFTDITNDFERFFINAPTTSGDAVQLGTQKGATTGAARALEFQTDGTTRLTIGATGAITTSGNVTFGNDIILNGAAAAQISWGSNYPAIGRQSTEFMVFVPGSLVNHQVGISSGTNATSLFVHGSYTNATNYQRLSIKTLRESSGALSGATYTTTIAIPAYANLIGVTTRVTTAVTGATTYDVGDGSDVDLWGAAIGVTLGSQSRTANFTAVAAVGAAATSRTVTLTANGSNFTGGVVEICLHYLTTEAD